MYPGISKSHTHTHTHTHTHAYTKYPDDEILHIWRVSTLKCGGFRYMDILQWLHLVRKSRNIFIYLLGEFILPTLWVWCERQRRRAKKRKGIKAQRVKPPTTSWPTDALIGDEEQNKNRRKRNRERYPNLNPKHFIRLLWPAGITQWAYYF